MSKKSYKVGYKNPPVEHQWSKGQSGNPSGKNSKKKELVPPLPMLIADQLEQPVEITVAGKVQKVSFSQALIMKMRQEAMTAPFKEKMAFFAQLAKLGVLDLQHERYEEEEEEVVHYTEEDRRLLELFSRELKDYQ